MTITVHEFDMLDKNHEPMFPPRRSTEVGSGSPVQLAKTTKYVVFSTTVAGYGVCTTTSTAATGAGFQLEAGKNFGFAVMEGGTLYCDGAAA